MKDLRLEHNQFLNNLDVLFRRDVMDDIDWDEKLLFIKGSRGVGKTTLILQHIKETFDYSEKALYVTMDGISIANTSLIQIAKSHMQSGGTHLFIDEIHKYTNWSQELKNIKDSFKKLHVTVSGSSILDLYKGNADLSRRAVTHVLYGLSFREFINIEAKTTIRRYSLNEIVEDNLKITQEVLDQVNPLQYFKSYLTHGYYPFYLEGTKYFHQKLNNTVNQVIEVDVPRLFNLEVSNIAKVKKLLYHIATSVPFQPNSSKLASSLALNRQTLNAYIQYLEQGHILNLLWDDAKSYSLISKPEKIYLQNPNLCHLVPTSQEDIGNLRETFFLNQVGMLHEVNSSKIGDFLVDKKLVFEVGGSGKSFKQISKVKNSYLAIDDELIGSKNKIPLWLFGFLG